MAVTARTLTLQAQLRRELEKITDAHVRALVAAWVDAWNEVEGDLREALLEQLVAGERVTKAQLLRSKRLMKALVVVADHLEGLARSAGVLITGDLRGVIDTAGAAQASVIDSQLPPGHRPGRLDSWSRSTTAAIARSCRRSTHQITARHYPLSPRRRTTATRRELIRGVAAGSNPKQTARGSSPGPRAGSTAASTGRWSSPAPRPSTRTGPAARWV
jgi:hypothetical protein